MLSGLLLGLAIAGAPAGVDLNDLDHWENTADRVLDGPAGCWEVVGHATWHWDAGRFGMSRGDAIFASRMVDGVWGPFYLEPLGEVIRERREIREDTFYGYDTRWVPLFGKVDEMVVVNKPSDRDLLPVEEHLRDPKAEAKAEEDAERQKARRDRRSDRRGESRTDGPKNVLREAIDDLTGTAAVMSWTQWDEEQQAVVLFRGLPLEDAGKEAEQTVAFPSGGPPTSMNLIFPKTWYRGTLPRVRISDAVVRLRVRPSGGQLFPTMEAYKLELGIFGITVTGAQTIRYTSIQPCSSAVVEAAPDGESPG